MRISVRLFAVVREKAGVSQVELELASPAKVEDAMKQLVAKFPMLVGDLGRCAVAVNLQKSSVESNLNDGDELAILPPVSGG